MTDDDVRKIVRDELGALLAAALSGLNAAGAFDDVLVVPFLEGLLDEAA